jgi:3-phenylpropionate/trans-cinnamate dioxygenase ferredoxin reductase subunit
MSTQPTFVIVGGGLAGAKAAEALRADAFEGRLVVIGAEPELPYERPPLSKGYLRAESERHEAHVHDEAFYSDNEIELRRGESAVSLDAADGTLELSGGERLGYDRLLLATGAEPRRLDVPGAGLSNIHYLRTLADADVLRAELPGTEHLVVVGAGWIGCEVAASARQLGVEVTVVEPADLPLERVLGPEVGRVFLDLHTDHGVRVLTGTGIESFEGDSSVARAVTGGGKALDCDRVAVGIGVVPRVELAASAGLAVGDGILVDERLRTSAPDVFAAGDVAGAEHPLLGGRVRVEHWANALNQGPAAARSMHGGTDPYDRLPYFFSDQYDFGMEYSGLARSWDEVVFRGDPARRKFIAFWLEGGRVVAGMNANVWDVTDPIQALIRAGEPVDPKRLCDPDVPLEDLVPGDGGDGP